VLAHVPRQPGSWLTWDVGQKTMRTLLCLLLLVASVGRAYSADDHIVLIKTEDTEMNAAIDAARQTLPEFWAAYNHPASDESEFYVKLAITDGKETEHFWIGRIGKEKDVLVGMIANKAELISNVKFGQKVVIDEKRISDWKFMKAGVTKGGYTIAVLLKHIPEGEAVEFKKQLGWK